MNQIHKTKKYAFLSVLTFCLTLAINPSFTNPQNHTYFWGFYGHRLINRMAVFILPSEMFPFYKKHIQYITEQAVAPDARRYVVEGEAPRHYIDLDVYGDSALTQLPKYWQEAITKFKPDTLMEYGIVPWHIHAMQQKLTYAFKKLDARLILKYSAEIGHYIGDANVPLHTTENYNGQLTNQYGIHGLWESRLPELFAENYDFFFQEAVYIEHTQIAAWEAVSIAHNALDSVLQMEKSITEKIGIDQKYSFESRNNLTTKVYSKQFSAAYHRAMKGMVERRMRYSIKMVADFWYTAWKNAGSPNLELIMDFELGEEDLKEMARISARKRLFEVLKTRPHEISDSTTIKKKKN